MPEASDHATASLHVLNGPNLNLLGKREPEIYGTQTLADIRSQCLARTGELGFECVFRQTNHEGELVDWVQEAGASAKGLVLNAAAYTHTSIALRDALAALKIPLIEVHLSNIYARERFRHRSHVSPFADGILCGFGASGYLMALDAMTRLISERAAIEPATV